MLNFNEKELINILIEKEDYNEFEAKQECEDLKKVNSQLQEALNTWLKTGKIINFSVKKVSIKKIMDKRGSNFLSALHTMSLFIDEPNEAKEFLKHNNFIRGFSLFKKYDKE